MRAECMIDVMRAFCGFTLACLLSVTHREMSMASSDGCSMSGSTHGSTSMRNTLAVPLAATVMLVGDQSTARRPARSGNATSKRAGLPPMTAECQPDQFVDTG